MHLISVVLSGGAGTRLWPISRQSYPKPFMELGGSTLLHQALARGSACGAIETLIVTNQEHHFLTEEVVAQSNNLPVTNYLLEPQGRNTAPAIALAALDIKNRYGADALMLVLPADHLIPDVEAFVSCAQEAMQSAKDGHIVVFGIMPTAPEVGFGYIEVQNKHQRSSQEVLRFVEKPNATTAANYLASGKHYWNSGMFCFSAGAILDAFEKFAPQVLEVSKNTLANAKSTTVDTKRNDKPTCNRPFSTRFDSQSFGLLPDISIDYAVLEHAKNVTMIPARFAWSDVGSWAAVADSHLQDASGNSFTENVIAIASTGTHVQCDSHTPKTIAVIGLNEIVIVDTPDALLVANKNQAQKVKLIVNELKERKNHTTVLPAVVQRPWGTYATLKEENQYKVKRITVKPGASLSLQYHHQRAEHWVVVQGLANVQIGSTTHETKPGQYHYIPLKETHRLTNIGKDALVLIEVQCGDYLGEDDIVRLEDMYGRV